MSLAKKLVLQKAATLAASISLKIQIWPQNITPVHHRKFEAQLGALIKLETEVALTSAPCTVRAPVGQFIRCISKSKRRRNFSTRCRHCSTTTSCQSTFWSVSTIRASRNSSRSQPKPSTRSSSHCWLPLATCSPVIGPGSVGRYDGGSKDILVTEVYKFRSDIYGNRKHSDILCYASLAHVRYSY